MDSTLTTTIDKSQIPPLHQKRILAFVNHFLIASCSFLNEFAEKCEYRFIEVERKLQKVKAALTILEAKLASIPNLEANEPPPSESSHTAVVREPETQVSTVAIDNEPAPAEEPGVMACNDARYKKYFKMLQVGVPAPAVKLKMKAEGHDASILDSPNALLADGIPADTS